MKEVLSVSGGCKNECFIADVGGDGEDGDGGDDTLGGLGNEATDCGGYLAMNVMVRYDDCGDGEEGLIG